MEGAGDGAEKHSTGRAGADQEELTITPPLWTVCAEGGARAYLPVGAGQRTNRKCSQVWQAQPCDASSCP